MYAEGVRSLSKYLIVTAFTFSVSVSSKCRCTSYSLKYILTAKHNMNSSHEKLFVRRNIRTKARFSSDVESKYSRSIKTVSKINENILLADMTGRTSCDKLLEKDNEGSLHNEMKPLLIVLRLLGCFPVYFSKSGKYTHTHTQTNKHTLLFDHMFKIYVCRRY